MVPYLNIHTHAADVVPGVAYVRCFEPSALLADIDSIPAMVSVGHHPWRVGGASKIQLADMAQLVQLPQVVAIGEVGLDKLTDSDFIVQQEVLLLQLRMAACLQKPIVIHCVKAWDELLLTLGKESNLPPVIIHGFRGKPQLARQLLANGCYLSIGLKYNAETVVSLPDGSFFLETDEQPNAQLPSLYAEIAQLRGLTVDELKDGMWRNWVSFTSIKPGLL